MPSEPVQDPLNRDRIKELAKPVIEIASPLLREVINYALYAFDKCQFTKKVESDITFPSFSLFAHMIQMADGIEVLVSEGCGTPGLLLLRSSFEARLSLKYMLEKYVVNRSIAWLIKHYDDEIHYFEIMDPVNPKGIAYREKHKDDEIYKMFGPPSVPGVTEQIAKLREAMNNPKYAEVRDEYEKRKKKTKHPEWYSLFDGPKSLKKLSEYFHEGAIYESLYRSWSKLSHASDTTHMSGNLRNPIPIVEVASTTVSHLVETTHLLINYFQPNREAHFLKWLNREVTPIQTRLIEYSVAHLDFLEKELKVNIKSQD